METYRRSSEIGLKIYLFPPIIVQVRTIAKYEDISMEQRRTVKETNPTGLEYTY